MDTVNSRYHISRGCLSPASRIRIAADVHHHSTSDDDSGCVLEEYSWVPSGIKPDMVHMYFACLPEDKIPYVNSTGEEWRARQLCYQLPPQDSDVEYCDKLNNKEIHELVQFEMRRKRESLGRGMIEQLPYDNKRRHCHQCKGSLYEGNLVISARRFGRDVHWHPQCFICTKCSNLLVDLIYFKHRANVYCGRHHAEQIKPRCAKCDEASSIPHQCLYRDRRFVGRSFVNYKAREFALETDVLKSIKTSFIQFNCISMVTLSGERFVRKQERISMWIDELKLSMVPSVVTASSAYLEKCTEAEGRTWHLAHFSCSDCGIQLGGQRYRYAVMYVPEHCKTYFNTVITLMGRVMRRKAITEKMKPDDIHWHADECCFCCSECGKNLLGKRYSFRDGKLCCGTDANCGKRYPKVTFDAKVMSISSKQRESVPEPPTRDPPSPPAENIYETVLPCSSKESDGINEIDHLRM
ncbi:Protein prickle [Dirofilaria immitis]|nr:Protein prickle [Dirofilaria immitis]